ncbi:MAG: signal peptidase II [Spirochaetae bacterium HGW-Spirochaetae-5]|nr:MAG: signal peptidase II [Spirochaetae bacterium HGW-Spirochaetae-5]
MRKHILPAITVLAVFTADAVTKNLALKHLGSYNSFDFFGGFLRLDLVFNRGGVFGIMQGYKNFFMIVSIIVLLIMVAYYFYERTMPALFRIAMALIIGGAAGNIFDRLVPGRPGVVDFFSVGVDGVYRWPTFNIADSVIIAGAILLVIIVYIEDKKKADGMEVNS